MRLVEEVHKAAAAVLREGDIVIDATVGNGHDTLFLAQQVKSTGLVYGFDIQAQAIANTRQRLAGVQEISLQLFQQGHETLQQSIPHTHHGQIKAILFNLGYLPGTDKKTITQAQSTTLALQQAAEIVAPGGLISVLCYTGHPGGMQEFVAIRECLLRLPDRQWHKQVINQNAVSAGEPVLFLLQKR